MNNPNGTNKVLQAQIVAQWITSLAISVICCAVLFIVFAGYIVELHDSTNLLSVKVELLQERNTMLQNEVAALKRTPVVQINGMPTPAATVGGVAQPPGTFAVVQPSAPVPVPAAEPAKDNGIVVPEAGGAVPEEPVAMPTPDLDQPVTERPAMPPVKAPAPAKLPAAAPAKPTK